MNYAASAHRDVPAKLPGWRATALFVALLAGLAGLIGRSAYLQVMHDDFLQEKGKGYMYRDCYTLQESDFKDAVIIPILK